MNVQEPPEGEQTTSRAATITLVLLSLGAVYLGFRIVRPFTAPTLTGAVFGVLLYPIYTRVLSRVHRPGLAATLCTTLMLLLFLGPVTLLIVTATRELTALYATLDPNGVDGQVQSLLHVIERPINAVAARLGIDAIDLEQTIGTKLSEFGGTILRQSITVIGAATGGVVFVVMSTIALFFALRDGPMLYQCCLKWSPLGRGPTAHLLDAARTMTIASFYGIVAVAMAQGFLLGVGAWIAGLPSPVLWGLAGAGVSLVPLLGSSLVWVPAALLLFSEGSVGKGIFMLAWGAAIVGTIDNLVRPMVVTARMPLNGFLVLIAILGGVQAFGVGGILLGPVILSTTMVLLQIVGERMRGEHTNGSGDVR